MKTGAMAVVTRTLNGKIEFAVSLVYSRKRSQRTATFVSISAITKWGANKRYSHRIRYPQGGISLSKKLRSDESIAVCDIRDFLKAESSLPGRDYEIHIPRHQYSGRNRLANIV